MNYNRFVRRVWEKSRVQSVEEAVQAIRATLLTLGERIFSEVVDPLEAKLDRELHRCFQEELHSAKLNEFFRQVAALEGVDVEDAECHARAVVEVLHEAVESGQIQNLIAEFPAEYRMLFLGEESQLLH